MQGSHVRSRLAGVAALALAAGCGGVQRDVDRRVIQLERGPAIRESGDSVTFGEFITLVAAPNGRYVVHEVGGPRLIAVYDSTGRLERLLGRKGPGPGEFMEIGAAGFLPGDTLLVGDGRNGSISVFTPGSHEFVRSYQANRNDARFRIERDGLFLPRGLVGGREGVTGYSLRWQSWDGRVTPVAPFMPPERIRTYERADSGRFWIAHSGSYEISLVTGDSVVRTIRRVVDWFPTDTTRSAAIGKRPFIADMQQDDEGLLWVLLRRPNPSWTGVPLSTNRPIDARRLPPVGEVYVGVIDVFDPASGDLIASIDVPGDMMDFLGPGRLYQRTDADSSGAILLQVWRARLQRE